MYSCVIQCIKMYVSHIGNSNRHTVFEKLAMVILFETCKNFKETSIL